MPRITVELLRKRSEHNEGIISTLEEISLHQEELERIEVIGSLCRKLRILYLQNNIIEKIEDLTHMKELRYLNLALNNISKIEGLAACEFLNKLDLTVNFVDFDTLEESIDHLKPLQHLRELYMLGNPCQSNWPENGFQEYVIASLPQLELLDGKEIHRSDRIKALQVFPQRQWYVREQAAVIRAEKAASAAATAKEQVVRDQDNNAHSAESDVIEVSTHEATDISTDASSPVAPVAESSSDNAAKKHSVLQSDEKVPYTPATRRAMYMELAEQKESEEARKRENQPRERDAESEHTATLRKTRLHEQQLSGDDDVRQCNEGKWPFRLHDELLDVVLEVDLPRFLDTSLIDVDVHPSYVSIVAKNKLMRLRFPELVHSDAGKAERSKVTGTLRLTLPKAHISETQKLRAQLQREAEAEAEQAREAARTKSTKKNPAMMRTDGDDDRAALRSRSLASGTSRVTKLSDEVLAAAAAAPVLPVADNQRSQAVQIRGLVSTSAANNQDEAQTRVQLTPIASKAAATTTTMTDKRSEALDPAADADACEEDDDAPPLLY